MNMNDQSAAQYPRYQRRAVRAAITAILQRASDMGLCPTIVIPSLQSLITANGHCHGSNVAAVRSAQLSSALLCSALLCSALLSSSLPTNFRRARQHTHC